MIEFAFNDDPYGREPELNSIREPIEYTLPSDWGCIYVSKAADEAYDLSLLAEGRDNGYVEITPKKGPPYVNIWLVSFNEFIRNISVFPDFSPDNSNKPIINALPSIIKNKDGVSLLIAFDKDRETVTEEVIVSTEERLGVDRENLDEELSRRSKEVPLPYQQEAAQRVTNVMVDSMRDIVYDTLPEALVEWHREINNAKYWKSLKVRTAGFLALGAAGTSLRLLTGGGTDTLELDELLYSLAGLGILGQQIKKYLDYSNFRERSFLTRAIDLTDTVAEAVHGAYSTKEFDARAQEWLDKEL